MINAIILNAKLSFNFWGEALLTACHVHNRIPSRKFKVSPYELWKGRKPNQGYLRVWGCLAFYRVTDPKRTKLGPRAIKSVFVGYVENSKAYRLLDLDSNVIVESKDVEFIEDKFYNDSKFVANPTPTQENNSNDLNPSISRKKRKEKRVHDLLTEPRRSQRVRNEKNLGPDFVSS
jgi:hypothetical protein